MRLFILISIAVIILIVIGRVERLRGDFDFDVFVEIIRSTFLGMKRFLLVEIVLLLIYIS